MPTKETLREKLAAIDKRKVEQLAALAAQRKRLKASLAKLEKPSKAERRLDARRKILVGSFLLDRMTASGKSPEELEIDGVRFWDWLVREGDRAVFGFPPKVGAQDKRSMTTGAGASSPAGGAATERRPRGDPRDRDAR